jgi:putative transposase
MPRTARSIVSGVYYHVINRGNNRATVFSEPREFDTFVELMRRAQGRHHIDVAAVCLMPNHFHLLVRPSAAADLAAWLHWMLTTHAARHHKKCNSSGRIWTSRLKAFPIQDDRHLLTVARYVERNALRASLVARAEAWPWSSLHWRVIDLPPFSLAQLPIAMPANWSDVVNAPQTATELAELRRCVNWGSPYGEFAWVQRTAVELGLTHTLRRPGRPKQVPSLCLSANSEDELAK